VNHTALARKNNPVEWLTMSMNGCIATLFDRLDPAPLPPFLKPGRKKKAAAPDL